MRNLLNVLPFQSPARLCADFLEGHCALGNSCNFAHGKQDLRPTHGKSRTKDSGTRGTKVGTKPEAQTGMAFAPFCSYEQAALKLILQSVGKKGENFRDFDVNKPGTSFSRQTTCEGLETSSAQFSRCSSDASDNTQIDTTDVGSSDPSTPLLEPEVCGWEVRVRNTFIEVDESEDGEEVTLRKSRSLPIF